jgi:transposase-like protein
MPKSVINTDLAPIYGSAIAGIKEGADAPQPVPPPTIQYLNNVIEQDHRTI